MRDKRLRFLAFRNSVNLKVELVVMVPVRAVTSAQGAYYCVYW